MSKKAHKKIKKKEKLRPDQFQNHGECVSWIKNCVYLIARGKKEKREGKDGFRWTTLGSGFLAAPNRLVTAAHVINNKATGKGESLHDDGDMYYLIRHSDDGTFHAHAFTPRISKEIFLFEEEDLGIVYLNDNFYEDKGQVYANKKDFIPISKELLPMGSEIGVLGYPICQLRFHDRNVLKPKAGDILLRTDSGVINCRYKTPEDKYIYNFTLAFNPGNSGGPIFNSKSGRAISIVKGYKSIPIKISEIELNEVLAKQLNLKKYKEKSIIEITKATYSVGFASPSFTDHLKEHGVLK